MYASLLPCTHLPNLLPRIFREHNDRPEISKCGWDSCNPQERNLSLSTYIWIEILDIHLTEWPKRRGIKQQTADYKEIQLHPWVKSFPGLEEILGPDSQENSGSQYCSKLFLSACLLILYKCSCSKMKRSMPQVHIMVSGMTESIRLCPTDWRDRQTSIEQQRLEQ